MPNRLASEQSPYLLQHANNPVDWYPWGAEAFEAARTSGKPIFLSIGYATCHWCHVMERESFESVGRGPRPERPVRLDQGRSRRAARRRSRLHDVRAGHHRRRRVADERVADAGSAAVLWRHLFPADVAVRPAGVSWMCSRKSAARGATIACNVVKSAAEIVDRLAAMARGPERSPAGRARRAGQDAAAVSADLRYPPRRLRRRAEVSAAERTAVPAARARAHRQRRARWRWWCRRCGRWRSAACAITSAAASTATRWTATGGCRISRRCSTTRRSSCWRISKRSRPPAIRSSRRSPKTRCSTCGAT